MTPASLQITYRLGRPLAAYYHLGPSRPGQVERSRELGHGLVADLDEDGRPVGVEITAPTLLTVEAFNAALEGLGLDPVPAAELAPLHAA